MNLSMKWLKEYVDIDVAPREFSEKMTMTGSKVEGFEIEGSEISKVVVGKVLSVVKHPNADTLVICQVDVGKNEPIQIVTGAKNLSVGSIVPVALDGSTLPNGVKITKGKLRGEISNGMMCSLKELNLAINDFPYAIEDGIFVLQEDCKIGQDIREAIGLNDTSVEFEITSNRPDCLSMIGLAREAAITFDTPLNLHQPVVKGSDGNINDMLSVEVKNTELCSRYCAKIVKNIKIEPSPRWMRERLRACGIRPINNIVDITNYVLLEYGQPMHAFDYKYVDGKKITIRNANDGEEITTLDDVTRKLSSEMLVISDEKGTSAVAGVMGGEFSSIMDDTTCVVFESANFQRGSVRRTAKKLGMRTESSSRFEKGLDPQNTLPALNRACELVELLGAGEVVNGVIDIDNSSKEQTVIPFNPQWINNFLGINLTDNEIKDILTKLDFVVSNGNIYVPSYRADVENKADIAEEIVRIFGYNNVPTVELKGSAKATLSPKQKFERTVSDTLLAQGLNEIITYSFMSPKAYDRINLPTNSALRNSIVISNPLGEDTSIMRTTPLPSMMSIIAKNYSNRNSYAHLFEIATIYIPTQNDALPIEKNLMTIGMYGNNCDFFSIKGIVEAVASRVGAKLSFNSLTDDPSMHPGRTANVYANGINIGFVGEVHPLVCDNYGISEKVYAALIDMEELFAQSSTQMSYTPLPKFPPIERDLALLCDDDMPVMDLEDAISSAVGKILEKIELFDIYKGSQISQDKKSVAFNLILRGSDRTLTLEEADNAIKKALNAVEKLGATLRV
ncbi:MAG: phenylalanine--tRNA ligase subunit beta [Oscillospiraceae bacterium]